jgi:hypothetical protein
VSGWTRGGRNQRGFSYVGCVRRLARTLEAVIVVMRIAARINGCPGAVCSLPGRHGLPIFAIAKNAALWQIAIVR